MAYTDDHRLASPQFREPRREEQSGIVFVHTSEGVMDDVGPDTGAENVASFITHRTDPGSYHVIGDSDSTVAVVRDECEAFQVAANGHNRHGWGFAFACRTTDLDPDHWWTQKAMALAGREIAAYWRRRGIDPRSAARWISKADADARRGPGLCCHGTVQPGDRSDAWTRHPRRAELEQMLIAAIVAASASSPTSTPASPGALRKDPAMFTVKNADGVSITYRVDRAGRLVGSWVGADGQRTRWSEVIPGLKVENLQEPLVAGRSIWLPVCAADDQFGDVLITLVQSEPGGIFEPHGTDELGKALAGLGQR